jgi:hypothetical protein
MKESTAYEDSVICLVGVGIVDGYGKCFSAAYDTEDKSVIVRIVNTVNPD